MNDPLELLNILADQKKQIDALKWELQKLKATIQAQAPSSDSDPMVLSVQVPEDYMLEGKDLQYYVTSAFTDALQGAFIDGFDKYVNTTSDPISLVKRYQLGVTLRKPHQPVVKKEYDWKEYDYDYYKNITNLAMKVSKELDEEVLAKLSYE